MVTILHVENSESGKGRGRERRGRQAGKTTGATVFRDADSHKS